MPNPKVGTVTMDVAGAVKASKGGAVEFRVEKAGIVQGSVGKASFDTSKLVENIKAFVDAVPRPSRPGAKGTYIQRVALSSTMGPGVKVDPVDVSAASLVDGSAPGRRRLTATKKGGIAPWQPVEGVIRKSVRAMAAPQFRVRSVRSAITSVRRLGWMGAGRDPASVGRVLSKTASASPGRPAGLNP